MFPAHSLCSYLNGGLLLIKIKCKCKYKEFYMTKSKKTGYLVISGLFKRKYVVYYNILSMNTHLKL